MKGFLNPRPSPAMVVALVALFVAMGGSASALVVITSKNIKNGTIRGKDIHKRTITAKRIKKNTLTGSVINESKLGAVPLASSISRVDRQSRTITLTATPGAQSVTATCATGLSAVGGGARLGDPANDFLSSSFPAGRNAWTAAGVAGSPTPGTLTAYVLCVPAASATP